MKAPILGPAYQARSNSLGNNRCVNLYAETAEDKQSGQTGALLAVPGFVEISTSGDPIYNNVLGTDDTWDVLIHPRIGMAIADEHGNTISTLTAETSTTSVFSSYGCQSASGNGIGSTLIAFAAADVFDIGIPNLTMEMWLSCENSDTFFTFYDSLNAEILEVRIDYDNASILKNGASIGTASYDQATSQRHFCLEAYSNGVNYDYILYLGGVEIINVASAAPTKTGAMRFTITLPAAAKLTEFALMTGEHRYGSEFTPASIPYGFS